ncbi:MAG: flavodoxin domain-containing protein [Kineosporiaceae bacterium]
MKVLVTAATRHGSTDEVAHAMAEALAAVGVETDVVTGDAVAAVETVDDYDAVVLGSAIYTGHWLEPAVRFAEAHASALAGRPVWLFSSGPVGDPSLLRLPEELERVRELTAAREHRVFAGRIDLDDLDDAERAHVERVGGQAGDYRDWAAVRHWATGIARELVGA